MYLMPLYDPAHLNELDKVELPSGSELTIAFLFEGNFTTSELKRISDKYQVSIVKFDQIVSLVSQTDVSKKATELVSKINCGGYLGERMKVLANMLSLNIHPAVHLLCVVDSLLERENYTSVITFGCGDSAFDFPERPDVKTLYCPEMSKTTLVNAYLLEKGVSIVAVKIRSSLVVKGSSLLRRLLLNGYKFYVTLKRQLQAPASAFHGLNVNDKANVGVLVRAQSEYWTVKPLLEQLEKSGYNPVIIQDDLIKNPSCKKTLDADSARYIPIHSAISTLRLIFIWLVSTSKFLLGTKFIKKHYRSTRLEDCLEKVFLSEDRVPVWAASSLHSLPELAVFEYEIKRFVERYDFKCLITMDMVDQWSAVVGDIGRKLNVKTLILQNTALDDIIYPRPIATDYMAVSGEKIRGFLLRSGALDSQILNFGLPIHDDIQRRYTPHVKRQAAPFKVMIATQPFVQTYDYNKNLIEDVVDVLDGLNVRSDVVIKPHPREDSNAYVKLVSSLVQSDSVNITVEASNNILEMAEGCDLFVSRTSTAIQSYILLGRLSVAYLNEYPADICDRLDYLSCDACVKLLDKVQLSQYVSTLVDNYDGVYSRFLKGREGYIDRYIGQFDGDAAEKICCFILD